MSAAVCLDAEDDLGDCRRSFGTPHEALAALLWERVLGRSGRGGGRREAAGEDDSANLQPLASPQPLGENGRGLA